MLPATSEVAPATSGTLRETLRETVSAAPRRGPGGDLRRLLQSDAGPLRGGPQHPARPGGRPPWPPRRSARRLRLSARTIARRRRPAKASAKSTKAPAQQGSAAPEHSRPSEARPRGAGGQEPALTSLATASLTPMHPPVNRATLGHLRRWLGKTNAAAWASSSSGSTLGRGRRDRPLRFSPSSTAETVKRQLRRCLG